MGSKVRKPVLGVFCFLLFLRPYSSTDTLEQGQEIKDGAELVSAGGHFRLGFLNVTSNNYYLGIWNNDDGARLENSVWIANRDTPIFNNSGSLTIDGNGSLKISHNGGLPIVLYSGQEATNISAVLLDSGNFVVHELSSEGLVKRELWQSFDYPTDTVLPGMKLGVNRKTGHTLSLTSWRSNVLPDTRSFTFGLHPNHTNQLVILWRGNIYWNSGPWNNRNFNVSALEPSYSFRKFGYVSNENETYFNISAKYGATRFPQIRIGSRGELTIEGNELAIDCYNDYKTEKGCVAQEIPECRRSEYLSQYYFDSTLTKDGFKFNEGENLTLVDCEAKCFNNCSCVAYASTNLYFQTGCQIWSTRPRTARNYSESDMDSVNVIYILEVQGKSN